jgi:hypothetical protein
MNKNKSNFNLLNNLKKTKVNNFIIKRFSNKIPKLGPRRLHPWIDVFFLAYLREN